MKDKLDKFYENKKNVSMTIIVIGVVLALCTALAILFTFLGI